MSQEEVDVGMSSDQSPEAATKFGALRKDTYLDLDRLPPEKQVNFKFLDINYTVETMGPNKQKLEKNILTNVSGEVHPGQCMAMMGPSGAGKTSLLDILCFRKKFTSGNILINGTPLSGTQFRRLAAYIPQFQHFLPSLTVRETMEFYSEVKLSHDKFSSEERKQRAESVIQEMRLTSCVDTYIGNKALKGLSGGELRRVGIGVELLTNPALIFLDEPTTGLDSSTALSIVSTIIQLAHSNRTIICTIHQPTATMFNSFHKLFLIAKGFPIYNGPVSQLVGYLDNINYPCPQFTNPADHILDLLTNYDTSETDEERINRLVTSYKESEMAKADEQLKEIGETKGGREYPRIQMATNTFTQIPLLLKNLWRDNVRNPLTARLKVIQGLFLGVLLGILFGTISHDQSGATSRLGLIAFQFVGATFGGIIATLATFAVREAIFHRDRRSECYTTAAFYVSLVISDLPWISLQTIFQGTLIYWICGLRPDAEHFFIFLFFFLLLQYTATAIGFSVSLFSPSVEVGNALGPLVAVFLVVFSGFFLNLDSVPVVFIWVPYISPIKWGLSAALYNEFHGVDLYCSQEELDRKDGHCDWETGDDFLKQYKYDDQNLEINAIILASIFFVCHFFGLFFLSRKAKKT